MCLSVKEEIRIDPYLIRMLFSSVVHHYNGVNTLCGEEHFWAVNDRHPDNENSEAAISLRRKTGAQTAGISTYGKCGKFSFTIKDIQVLEI